MQGKSWRVYLDLIRKNPDFTRFWIGQFISMIGDWMNTVAILGLLLSLTGSDEATSLYFIFSLLPFVLVTPIAGVFADRYNRKTIMLLSNFVSFFLVLGFLLIQKPSQVWLLYGINMLASVAEAFYVPCAQASFPILVERESLYTANTLSGATWGITLAVGSGLGGIVDILFGRNVCFIANAVSFLIAGILIMTIKRPFSRENSSKMSGGWSNFKKGLEYASCRPPLLKLFFFESCLGFATGIVLLYSVFPVKIFHDGDFGIGVLYAIRGIANFPGPFVVHALVPEDSHSLWKGMAVSGFIIGVSYLFFSISPNLAIAGIVVFCAHMANAAFWVMAILFMQRSVSNEFLGRISSFYTASFTVSMSFSSLICGFLSQHFSPRWAAGIFGILTLILTLAVSQTPES